MPAWAWIIVTVVTGLGSGLLGTLVRVHHDRGADLRRRSLEVVEEVAARSDSWFQAVQAAIDARWDGLLETNESNTAFQAAEEAVAGARRDVNRMHALLPRKSRTALHAAGMIGALHEALEPLRDWPPEPEEADDPAEYAADWSGDKSEWHPVFTPINEELDEARMWRTLGLEAFGYFIEVAPAELRGGFWPAVARGLRLPAKGSRKIRRAMRRRQDARHHRRWLKERAARTAERDA